MREKLFSFEDSDKGLILEVESNLTYVEKEVVIPFWDTMQLSSLQGKYRLSVNIKVKGCDDKVGMVKIIGIANGHGLVKVKFQSSPTNCYSGTLSSVRDSTSKNAVYGSNLCLSLQEVAGIKWFNPARPNDKHDVVVSVAEPLTNIGDVMASAVERESAPAEVFHFSDVLTEQVSESLSTPITNKPRKTKGLASDNVLQGLVFEEMYRVSDHGVIYSKMITEILAGLMQVNGSNGARQAGGPIIRAWKNSGLIESYGEKVFGKGLPYSITEKAVKEFNLLLPLPASEKVTEVQIAPSVPDEAPMVIPEAPEPVNVLEVKQPIVEKVAVNGSDILSQLAELKSKAEKAPEIRDQIKAVENEIKQLNEKRVFLINSLTDYIEAEKKWLSLVAMVGSVVERR